MPQPSFIGPSLALSAILFSIGVAGVLLRRNAIIGFMCFEIMLNAANLRFNRPGPTARCQRADQGASPPGPWLPRRLRSRRNHPGIFRIGIRGLKNTLVKV